MRCIAALASLLASSAVLAAPSSNLKELHKRQNLHCHGDKPYTRIEMFLLEPFTGATCNDIYRAVTACINERPVHWTCGSALIRGPEAVLGHAEVPYEEFPGDCAAKRLEKIYSTEQIEFTERRCNMPDPPEVEERGLVKLVHDRQFRCEYSVDHYFFYNHNIQVGAPYDAGHCDEIESTLGIRCSPLHGLFGSMAPWTCNDDGSGMYGEGAVGAYDFSFSIVGSDNLNSCIQEVLNDMFPDVRDVTGGFQCHPPIGTDKIDADEANNSVEERGLVKRIDDEQFDCVGLEDPYKPFLHYYVQIGAPYDVYHCFDIESNLTDRCDSNLVVGPSGAWECYDDGSTMYGGGDIGAYDIHFTLSYGSNTCIEEVFDDMFPDLCNNSNGLKCDAPPSSPPSPHSDTSTATMVQERSADWDVGDYDYKCEHSTSVATELFHIQIGAPYDLNHCLDLEKSMRLCQDPPASWQCYDDGSPRYYNGDVGAYDIHFGMAAGSQTCVEIVLDNEFAAVARNTGGFSCPSSGPEPPAQANAVPSANI